MFFVSTIFLNISILLTVNVYAQKTVDNVCIAKGLGLIDKKIIAEYLGGRYGFSVLSLTLYSDSSYLYTSWSHTGESYVDKGKFARHKSKINLRSDTVITLADIFGPRNIIVFKNNTYRVKENKILLYSRREELFDRHEFYETYYTLFKVDPTSEKELQ